MKQKILILYLDALRHDYLDKMSFLNNLAQKSLSGKLTSELGYTNNMGAFFTGKAASESGKFAHMIYNENSNFKWCRPILPFFSFLENIGLKKLSRFSLFSILSLANVLKGTHWIVKLDGIPLEMVSNIDIKNKKSYGEEGCFDIESLFSLAREKGYKFHFYMAPFYSTNDKTSFSPFELALSNSDEHRYKKFKKMLDKEGDIFMVQLWDMDKKAHNYEINSQEVLDSIKNTDKMAEDLIKKFREKHPGGNVIIWSDHGMTPIKKTVDLELKPNKDYFYFLDSTLARFWPFNKSKESIIRKNMKEKGLIEIDSKLKKKYGLDFKDNSYGELMFTANPGTLIFPNFFADKHIQKNMHGFFPETETEKGIYIINSKETKPQKKNLMIRDLYGITKNMIKERKNK